MSVILHQPTSPPDAVGVASSAASPAPAVPGKGSASAGRLKRLWRNPVVAHLWGLLVLAGLAVLAFWFFDLAELSRHLRSWIAGLGTVGMVTFPFAYGICNVLLLPAGILGISAGFIYGLLPGFLLVLSGNLLGAAIAFGLSRCFLRGWVERKLRHHPKFAAIDRMIAREGPKIVFLTQLNPLFPTSLFNYFYGVTSLGFRRTLLWIALGQAPGLFLYAYLGTLGLASLDALEGHLQGSTTELCLLIGGLVMTLGFSIWLVHAGHQALKESFAEDQARQRQQAATSRDDLDAHQPSADYTA